MEDPLKRDQELERLDGSPALIEQQYIKIKFQLGPVKLFKSQKEQINGCQIDGIIHILIDRLEGFQHGQFHCRENAAAIMKLQSAVAWLEHRTRDREQRGVEGKNET